jgi:hypothetical protein
LEEEEEEEEEEIIRMLKYFEIQSFYGITSVL